MTAQANLRVAEAQADILEAFPETVCIVGHDGLILAVNGAWRRFGESNTPAGGFPGVGSNYLEICDRAQGPDAVEAAAAAAGLRSILDGRVEKFQLEYPCHSPGRQNWFRLIASPLGGIRRGAALVVHVDITESKLRAEELKESKGLLEVASRVSRVGAWRIDYPGPVLTWSDEVRAIYEVPADFRPSVDAAFAFYGPAYRDLVQAAVQTCLEAGTGFDIKAQLFSARGRLLWARVIGEAVRDPQGQISRLQGAFQDITESEETHARVERLSRQLSATLESMSDAFLLLDSEWRFIHVNAEAEKLLRQTRDLLIGRSFWTEFPATIGTIVEQKFREAVESTLPVTFENYYPPLENWFEIRAFQSPEGLAVYFRPITERKRAEERLQLQAESLRNSEREYRLLFAGNPQPMWVVDQENLQFLAVNASAVRHYGYSEHEFLSMTELDIRPHEDGSPFLTRMKAAPTQVLVRSRHLKRDGTLIEVEITSNNIGKFADRSARVVSINDITERLQSEREARRMQRLESIGTLAGGVAHDLNNLLSPITLGIGLLRLSAAGNDDLETIATMESNAKRATSVVSQLLSFARGAEGARVPLEVGAVIGEVVSIASHTFPKNITIESRIEPGLWPAFADATQIHQILLNLCLNARDAMPTGGRIVLRASRAHLDERQAAEHVGTQAGRFVLLQVSDTGSGIAPEVLDRIFEPFFTTKALGEGSGLGLANVLGIARGHGGCVTVTSKIGKGSTFSVYIPAAPGAELIAAPVAAGLPHGQDQLILLVDDEAPILEMTSKVLRAYGYRVLVAEDGTRAAGLYAQNLAEIALVFTDLMMPDMDGASLIGTLLRMNPAVRVIAASGQNMNAHDGKVLTAGSFVFLAKPYSAEAMLKAVASALAFSPGAKSRS